MEFEEYVAAAGRHGNQPVTIRLSALDWMLVVGVLQVALRDREFARRAEQGAEQAHRLVDAIGLTLGKIDPVFGEIIQAGWRN